MIQQVKITRLRGIANGTVDGLTPLSVLVGPNGCGKSTVLDALLLATSRTPADAAGRVVRRRRELPSGAAWVLYRRGEEEPTVIEVTAKDGTRRRCEVSAGSNRADGSSALRLVVAGNTGTVSSGAEFPRGNSGYVPVNTVTVPPVGGIQDVRLVEPAPGALQAALDRVFTEAVQRGARRSVHELLAAVVPGLESVEILTDEASKPVVHLVYEWGSVPVALAGDGVFTLARLCFELASRPSGLALVEEPETHQHPRSLRQTARVIIEATERGMQVVLSTHSVELIDMFLDELSGERLARLSVHRLSLLDGELVATVSTGDEVVFARRQVEQDLR